MDPARNNFSTVVYGNGDGRGPATGAYDSWTAGSIIRWTQCAHAQSPLRVAEIFYNRENTSG